jgi:hypothetical protein
MTPETALQNIYNATRLAPLTAQQHEFLTECAKTIAEALKSVEPKQETEE